MPHRWTRLGTSEPDSTRGWLPWFSPAVSPTSASKKDRTEGVKAAILAPTSQYKLVGMLGALGEGAGWYPGGNGIAPRRSKAACQGVTALRLPENLRTTENRIRVGVANTLSMRSTLLGVPGACHMNASAVWQGVLSGHSLLTSDIVFFALRAYDHARPPVVFTKTHAVLCCHSWLNC